MKYVIACLALVAAASTIVALPLTDEQAAQLDQLVDGSVSEGSPGLAVGIVRDGDVVYERYAGLAELSHGVPIDARTRFNIASNGKQFTALAVLRLVGDGTLRLDDDIRTYLPEFYTAIDAPITIAHLLKHTSGIRDVYDLWALTGKTWWKLFVGNRDALALLEAQRDLNFAPGSDYLYSNSNYLLLAEMIQRVTDTPFDEVADRMFVDLGMPDTSFLTGYMEVLPDKARPYGEWSGWKEYPSVTGLHGDGALYTTLGDQLAWERLVQIGGEGERANLIATSQRPIARDGFEDYGYGIEFGTYKGLPSVHHAGSTGAYSAHFRRYPDQRLSVVVMSNSGQVSSEYVARMSSEILLGDAMSAAVYPAGPDDVGEPQPIERLLGDYLTGDGTLIRILERDGDLYREIYQRDPVRLIPEAGAMYYYESLPDLKMVFSTDEQGQRIFTLYMASQRPSVGLRLPDDRLESADLDALEGRYVNDETATEIVLAHGEGRTYALTKNGRERDAELLRADLLRMNSYEIRILRDDDRSVVGLSVDNNRIRNVSFRRID